MAVHKILIRKYMTLSEFIAYLTNGRPPMEDLFCKQFDASFPFSKQDFLNAELRARCLLELGQAHATGYRYSKFPILSLPIAFIAALSGIIFFNLIRPSLKKIIETEPLYPPLMACLLFLNLKPLNALRPYFRIKEYRLIKRKYCLEKKAYIDGIPRAQIEHCEFVERDSYLPTGFSPLIENKILQYAVEDKGIVDGRIGITPNTMSKLGSYCFDLSKNRAFVTYKDPFKPNSFLFKAFSPLYRRFTGWEDIQISTKDVIEKYPSLNKPEFECEYEWETKPYTDTDLKMGEYDLESASLYYTLCKGIYADLDLEHTSDKYSAADLRQEIIKRAPNIAEKRILALLGVLPHGSKGGRPMGKKS